jgi:hypothetical protein
VPTRIYILSFAHTLFKVNMSLTQTTRAHPPAEMLRPAVGFAPQFGNLCVRRKSIWCEQCWRNLYLAVKRPEIEADHWPLFTAEIQEHRPSQYSSCASLLGRSLRGTFSILFRYFTLYITTSEHVALTAKCHVRHKRWTAETREEVVMPAVSCYAWV